MRSPLWPRLPTTRRFARNTRILSDACGHAATPHIRNMATIGGNVLQELQCWYFRSAEFQCIRKGKDLCFAFSGLNQYHAIMDYGGCPSVAPSSGAVALLALDATIELTSAAKGKRTVAIKDFYVQPDANPHRFNVKADDELLTAIHIPKPAPGTRSAYQKYGEKESHDWAIADAGILLEMDGDICRHAVVTMGAASPVVRRSPEAEAALTGKPITQRHGARCRTGFHDRCHAALDECLQGAALPYRHLPDHPAGRRTDGARSQRRWLTVTPAPALTSAQKGSR